MRFGHEFDRRLVPEWAWHAVDYNLLKRLIKSDVAPDQICERLDANISALDSFLWQQINSVIEIEEEVYELFDFDPKSLKTASEICPFELTLLVDSWIEFQRNLKKLEWFARINIEAVDRILDKLKEHGTPDSDHVDRLEVQDRWHELRSAWEAELSLRLNRIKGLITNASAGLSLPGRMTGKSIYLDRILRQRHGTLHQDSMGAVRSALEAGDVDRTVQSLASAQPQTKGDTNYTSLLRDMVIFSALFLPAQYETLLALVPSSERAGIARDALNWSIMSVGRRRQRRAIQSTMGGTVMEELVNLKYKFSDDIQLPKLSLPEDKFRRLPLHYAAAYGLTDLCQSLVLENQDAAARMILSADCYHSTPLYLAVSAGHAGTAIYLMRCLTVHVSKTPEARSTARTTMAKIVQVAMRSQNDPIVVDLLSHCADVTNITYQSVRGETALHVAAQVGRVDYASLVLQVMSEQGAQNQHDATEISRGWTALFFACANGNRDMVKLLLDAGLGQEKTDTNGWTAKEHATFRGHMAVAELFKPSDVRDRTGGPTGLQAQKKKKNPKSIYDSPRCSPGERVIIATLGTARTDRIVTQVDLSYCSSVHTPGTYPDLSFVLEVSALGSSSVHRQVRLPILHDQINDPFVFVIPDTTKPQLVFRVIKTAGTRDGEDVIVGCGTAFLERHLHQFGPGRQSLVRDQTVPILDRETMTVAGTVTFNFLIANLFPHLQELRPVEFNNPLGPTSPILVGHRGAGQNLLTHEYLQLGENTIESFLSAAKLGATFVEFDVQVTRDLHPVAFHDFSLSESGTDVAVHDVTLDQFLHASNIQSPHGNPLSVLGKVHSRAEAAGGGRPRSRSLGGQFEAGAIQIRDRLKHTVDFKKNGFKPNSRGDFIQDSFATLEEILTQLPEHIGCDIEIS